MTPQTRLVPKVQNPVGADGPESPEGPAGPACPVGPAGPTSPTGPASPAEGTIGMKWAPINAMCTQQPTKKHLARRGGHGFLTFYM